MSEGERPHLRTGGEGIVSRYDWGRGAMSYDWERGATSLYDWGRGDHMS